MTPTSTVRSWPVLLLLLSVTACSFTGLMDRWTGEDVNRMVRESGLEATAAVLGLRDTGVTVNDDPVVELHLEVRAEGRPPWEAHTRMLVSRLAIPQVQPGAELAVFYDPTDPSRVAIATDPPTAQPSPSTGTVELGDDLRVEHLTAGVWRHVSTFDLGDGHPVPANGLVVVSDGAAALIDTPWTDDQTRRLISWVGKVLDAPVSSVVATHSHQDCAGGLAAAHLAGTRTFALERTAEYLVAAGETEPQVRFPDRLALTVGSFTVELRHLGAGHTDDGLVAWIDEAGVLFGGCTVRPASGRSLGYTDEADLEHWPETLQAIRETFPAAEIVVPGHGAPGGLALIEHSLQLLADAEVSGP